MYKFTGKKGQMYIMDVIKLNANCPLEEKIGTGPGSCGGSKEESSTIKDFPHNIKLKTTLVNGKPRYIVISPEGKVSLDTDRVKDVEKTLRSLIKYYGKGKTDIKVKLDVPKSITGTPKQTPTETKEISNTENKKTVTAKTDPNQSPKTGVSKPKIAITTPTNIPSRQVNLPLGTARVYSISSAKITIQDGMNKTKTDKMLQTIKNLPEKLLSEKPEILIRKGDSSGGKERTKLSKEYGKKFVSGGHTGGNSIVAYNMDTNTIVHEIAHTFDKSSYRHSSSKEYEDAVDSDNNGFTSPYAKDSYKVYYLNTKRRYCEDFADGIASFLDDQKWFTNKFPNRAKYYRKILDM